MLDDFEQNITEAYIEDGSLRLAEVAYEALEALCFALEESGAASRLIVTCRYHAPKALPPNRLFVQPLSGMPPTDIGKKVQSLVFGVAEAKRNRKREQKIVEVADGNPRLLEWLMKLALQTDLVEDAFLASLTAVENKFRENILAEKLLGALSEPERKALARMTLFQLPVPKPVVAELSHGAPVENAIGLGLLEQQVARKDDLYRVTAALEPLLRPALSELEWAEARRQAARKLYEVWWNDPEKPREDRGLEVVRVAVAAGEQELAIGPADIVATRWNNRSRYLEVVALCRLVLAAFDDYRILGTIARAEVVLGDTKSARSHYERALSGCPPSDDREKSATMSNLASLSTQQGDIKRALELWQQALEILERIGNQTGKAAALNNMAGVIAQQGDTERALELWQQSLEILERVGNVKGKAATLHNMAGVIAQQGDIERALQLWQQSLEIKERIGDVRGKAATLHAMAGVIAQQGDIERALELWQQSLDIDERIGDVQGKAATLANMAWAAGQSGDHARHDQLNRQAVEALGSVRAYVDLVTVLGNLGVTAQQDREIFAAQAAWLAVKVQAPVDASLRVLSLLFNLVPQGDPLEPLLGAAALILVATRGEKYPQREKLGEQAAKLLSIAAANAGIQDPQALPLWLTQNRLADRAHVFPRLLALLEQLVGDRWLFDRAPLDDRAGPASAGNQ